MIALISVANPVLGVAFSRLPDRLASTGDSSEFYPSCGSIISVCESEAVPVIRRDPHANRFVVPTSGEYDVVCGHPLVFCAFEQFDRVSGHITNMGRLRPGVYRS